MPIESVRMESPGPIVSRISALIMVWALIAVVGIVPLLLNLSNPVDTYYYPKARALYFLAPLLAVAWLVFARTAPQAISRSVVIPALVFALVATVATIGSVDPAWSLRGAPWRHEGLLTLLSYVVIFLATCTVRLPSMVSRWLAAVLIAASLVAAYGIAQHFGYEWLVLDAQRLGWSHAFSTTGNPNFLGSYMVLVVPLAIAAALTARRTMTLTLSTLALTIVYLAALFTYSRGAWAGLVLVVVVLSVFVWGRRPGKDFWRYLWLLAWLVALAAIFLIPDGPLAPAQLSELPIVRARSVVEFGSVSVQIRPYVWKKTIPLIMKRPLLGYGPETFPIVFPQEWDDEKRKLLGEPPPFTRLVIDKAHNDVLDTAMSVGLLGVAAFWWIVVTSLRTAWRAGQREDATGILALGCIAGIAGYLLDLQFQFSIVSVAPVFWSVLGVAAALGGGASRAGTQG